MDELLQNRILGTARVLLFRYGYKALTMDVLAEELGMSKKTLYAHIAGKDAVVKQVIAGFADEIIASADVLSEDKSLSFTTKLARFAGDLSQRFSTLPPHFFRELERFAPEVYQQIEELRSRNIPIIFGRLLAEGKEKGWVRDGVDAEFATEFWRAAMQGVIQPDVAERLNLRPDQIINQALHLFCGGLLTSKGIKDYEKQI